MRVLFVTTHPYLPQQTGGMEVSIDQLCRALVRQGHDAAVMAPLVRRGATWLSNRLRGKLQRGRTFPADSALRYPVYRGYSMEAGLLEVVQHFRPRAGVVAGSRPGTLEIAASLAGLGCRTFYTAHEVGFIRRYPRLPTAPGLSYLANSRFTAACLLQAYGVAATVIPPLVRAQDYGTRTSGRYATLINPHPMKGVDIVLDVARSCPDIPFLFVESWRGESSRASIRARARMIDNIEWRRSTRDMRKVYGVTRVLLMPTVVPEAWGRVATEGHFSGIPTIATDIGGLPESVGKGGILLPPGSPPEQWARALRSVWDDPAAYRALSASALEYSRRPEIDPATLVRRFVQALEEGCQAACRENDTALG